MSQQPYLCQKLKIFFIWTNCCFVCDLW